VESSALAMRWVLEAIRGARVNGLTLARLEKALAAAGQEIEDRTTLLAALGELERRGQVVRGTSGRITAVEYTDYFTGTLKVTSAGFGILRQEEAGQPEMVVAPEGMATAMDGDLVLVHRTMKRRKGVLQPERYGVVTTVLRRRRETLVGRFRPHPERPWVDPFARRVAAPVLLDEKPAELPEEGELVEVAVTDFGETGPLRGHLLRRIGQLSEAGVDEEVVLAEAGIPVEFPPGALREAAALPATVPEEDTRGRRDYRDQPAVTIDGETARDFDDAVVAFARPDGGIEVFVHIADVSFYVRPGSAIDDAARERGTSVYLPSRAIPMLPEGLSSHLCSLLADQDRLVFTVRFVVAPNGAVDGYRAERAVFRSRRRCTYNEVFAWLDQGFPADLPAGVEASLKLLDEAALRLGERRQARGSIDFDLPEPEILLDPQGFMTGIRAGERNRAHRLIEELMVAANECVARMLTWSRQQGIFRVHDKPSPGKLAELQAVIGEFGLALKGDLEDLPPRELQRVLKAVAGRPEERLVHALTLRALARAVYLPSCKGHYALATDHYLHFTSPIRRYPDLVVHRFLAEGLAGQVRQGVERELVEAELEELARHCSLTERRADEAERDVIRYKQAAFMLERVGQVFAGHVSGVVAFGLFVQLDEVFVEGMVHVSELRDDFYRYDESGHRLVGERWGRVLRLGDAIQARVLGVDEERMEVRLAPVLEPLETPRKRSDVRRSGEARRSGGSGRPGEAGRSGETHRPGAAHRSEQPGEVKRPRPPRRPPGRRRSHR
jgi:ribonuclease R